MLKVMHTRRRDLLPKVIPNTRIFTWGYDVDLSNIFSVAGQATVFQHAGSLMIDLANVRTLSKCVSQCVFGSSGANVRPTQKNRPIIFIAHSLGGVIVKDVRYIFYYFGTWINKYDRCSMPHALR